jgi:hypothetical protein
MYIASHGVYYSDSRETGFTATHIKSGKLLAKKPKLYSFSHVSHNWSWQIGSNDRILSEGILMYSAADQGLKLLPGRLGNSVSGGYRSPTKPLIADGRFIFRMPDKLVCYDLRMNDEAARTEVIQLTAKGAAVAGPNEFDVKIRIRKRGDKLISLGGKAPDITSPDTRLAASWGPQDWSQVSWYRSVIPHDLKLTDDAATHSAAPIPASSSHWTSRSPPRATWSGRLWRNPTAAATSTSTWTRAVAASKRCEQAVLPMPGSALSSASIRMKR